MTMTLTIKSVIRPLVPPFIYEALHRAKAHWFPKPPPPFSYSARQSFGEAAIEAGIGYGHQRLLSRFVDARAPLDKMSDFTGAFLASIAKVSANVDAAHIRVLDFGGASGYFRNHVDAFFDGKIKTDWRIVETLEQVDHNSTLDCASVRYATSIGDLPFDLAVFSGSLHCLEDWRTPLQRTDAEWIFIARTPLGDIEQAFLQRTVREGHAFSYPGQVIARSALFDLLQQSHQMVACWQFDAHLLEMGVFPAPAMLWQRKVNKRDADQLLS